MNKDLLFANIGLTTAYATFLQQTVVGTVNWITAIFFITLACSVAYARRMYVTRRKFRLAAIFMYFIGRVVLYWNFILAVYMIEISDHKGMLFSDWAGWAITALEAWGVVENVFKARGVDLSPRALLSFILSKVLRMDIDVDKFINKDKDK